MRTYRLAILAALGALSLGACTAQFTEQQLIRPVPGGTLSPEAAAAAAPAYRVTPHTIAAADGTRLHAVLLRQPGARATILYFGGNGYTIGRFGAATAAFFAPLGVDLMIVDHRGYGLSEGVPTVAQMEADGLASFDYLAALPGRGPRAIVVHGQSLGSFIAGNVAANRPAAAVVLESSVTTTEEWVRSQGGSMGALLRVEIGESLRGRGNLAYVARISEPLLLLVGSSDTTTPPRFSEALYAASPLPAQRKLLAVIEGAGHNDVLLRPEAAAVYARFLAAALQQEP
jgi:fermentation-respiration switch protein FrsA (DUF1100 family)